MSADARLAGMFNLLRILPADVRLRMVDMYRQSLVSQLELLAAALAREEQADMLSLSHKIAGSAAMMQDQELSLAARAMEAALREGRATEAMEHWPRVQGCAGRTLEGLRQASAQAH